MSSVTLLHLGSGGRIMERWRRPILAKAPAARAVRDATDMAQAAIANAACRNVRRFIERLPIRFQMSYLVIHRHRKLGVLEPLQDLVQCTDRSTADTVLTFRTAGSVKLRHWFIFL